MDQILVSVCCPPQNDTQTSKTLQIVMLVVGVILKRHQKRPKIHVVVLLLHLLRHTFIVQAVSQELL